MTNEVTFCIVLGEKYTVIINTNTPIFWTNTLLIRAIIVQEINYLIVRTATEKVRVFEQFYDLRPKSRSLTYLDQCINPSS